MIKTTTRLAGLAVGALAASLLATPTLVATSASAIAPEDRPSTPPNVIYPVKAKEAQDLRTFGRRPGTEIKARCGRMVRAAHPGTAVVSRSETAGPALVRVVSSPGRIVTTYGYMPSTIVTTGQIIQAGQQLGVVGHTGRATTCSLYFAVTTGNGARTYNPTRWLRRNVGKPMPGNALFGNYGFVVASFNVLGASHTKDSTRYATWDVRLRGQISMFAEYAVDVVGLQEFQMKQRNAFRTMTGSTYGIYPTDEMMGDRRTDDPENSIIWRNSVMEFVSGETISVPYFERDRQMPVVLLRHRATGRTAYFINVHNPASGVGYGDQTANRRKAISIERSKVISLRATGRPVFLVGDFNDRLAAFCPLTAGKLMITPDSIPSTTCAPPPKVHIDWVFAAGGTRFSRYARDWAPKDQRLTDHPIVWARAHLSE